MTVCDDAATLAHLANRVCITPHPWLSRTGGLDTPEGLILDLHPRNDGAPVVCAPDDAPSGSGRHGRQ
jgi:DNA primase